jgi:NTP pyrophosphatase (non-canonical NTP hydrolase)
MPGNWRSWSPTTLNHEPFCLEPRTVNHELGALLAQIREFVRERDWSQYHSPKNLSTALTVEAAELAEIFQWLTEDQSRNLSPEQKAHAAEEIGDVLIYLVNLADKLGIEPLEAALAKLEKNRQKYPVEKAKGSAAKYDEFDRKASARRKGRQS